jgi:hypothetical protein
MRTHVGMVEEPITGTVYQQKVAVEQDASWYSVAICRLLQTAAFT